MSATTRRRKPEECWRVVELGDRVLIEPPMNIDREYDDLLLNIGGNFLQEDGKKIAQIICDKLNS